MRSFMLVLLGLLILGGLAFLLAVRVRRWPELHTGFIRLGDAVISFALGLTGLAIVVIVLRALGWIPPTR
jgi:hypothetical protein